MPADTTLVSLVCSFPCSLNFSYGLVVRRTARHEDKLLLQPLKLQSQCWHVNGQLTLICLLSETFGLCVGPLSTHLILVVLEVTAGIFVRHDYLFYIYGKSLTNELLKFIYSIDQPWLPPSA